MKHIFNILIALGIVGMGNTVLARGVFYSCDTMDAIKASKAQCSKCKNRVWVEGWCYPNEESVPKPDPCADDPDPCCHVRGTTDYQCCLTPDTCECNPNQCKCPDYAEAYPCECTPEKMTHWNCHDCPDNGTLMGEMAGTFASKMGCCKDFRLWSGDSYSIPSPDICGCPEGSVPSSDGTTCCLGIRAWDGYQYKESPICGCPEGQTLGVSGKVCCEENSTDLCECDPTYAIENPCECYGKKSCECNPEQCGCDEYYNNNLCECSAKYRGEHLCECLPEDLRTEEYCVCPDGGDIAWSRGGEQFCCKDNLAWDGSSYSKLSPENCGCPNGGKPSVDGSTCCQGFKSWDGKGYNTTSYGICGCPEGMEQGATGKVCCYANYEVRFSGDNWRIWTASGGGRINPNECGCPNGGENINGTCCKDKYSYYSHDWDYDTPSYPACGCPYKEINGHCCTDGGMSWTNQSQAWKPSVCGCPDGGNLASDGKTCCKNNLASTGSGYSSVSTEMCGCPVALTNGICCYNNYAWSGTQKSVNIDICGCPDGGNLASDGKTCCKNNLAWGTSSYSKLSIETCGCPNGGEPSSDGTTCCLNGKGWSYGTTYSKYTTSCSN